LKDGKDLKIFNKNLSDDPQILIYSKALAEIYHYRHQEVKQAGWVSLREAKEAQRDLRIEVTTEGLNQIENQIREDLDQVWIGKPMPANGPQQVCKYCDARGICRKGMWEA